jgi:hypothetical protein
MAAATPFPNRLQAGSYRGNSFGAAVLFLRFLYVFAATGFSGIGAGLEPGVPGMP